MTRQAELQIIILDLLRRISINSTISQSSMIGTVKASTRVVIGLLKDLETYSKELEGLEILQSAQKSNLVQS